MSATLPERTWRPDSRKYHATASHWGSTMLGDFRDSPSLAHGRYVSQLLDRPEPSIEMLIGSAVHALLLEPVEAARTIKTVACQARSHGSYKSAVATGQWDLVLTEPMRETAQAIANNIRFPQTRAAEVACKLLLDDPGESEFAFKWDDSTGVPCKIKLDRLTINGGRIVEVSLKTTRDPSPEHFCRDFYNFGYHAQAAFYRRGAQVLLGGYCPPCFVVGIRNADPYEIAVYPVEEELLAAGAVVVEQDLRRLARCLAGTAAWCAEWESLPGALPTLSLPSWARRQLDSGSTVIDTF